MNVLVTINKKYLTQLKTMINSLVSNNGNNINLYVVANDIESNELEDAFKKYNININLIKYKDDILDNAPTSNRYPSVIYYRLLAPKYLPNNLERILYLDPDIIVLKDLSELYTTDFEDMYFVGSSNVRNGLRKFNEIKNRAPKDSPYLNTGVLLLNLKELRNVISSEKIYDYISKYKRCLCLPDQDILQGLYGDRVKLVSNIKYNLSDRAINLYNMRHDDKIDNKWVEENCSIIHYYGRNKPWKDKYKGILKQYYIKYRVE